MKKNELIQAYNQIPFSDDPLQIEFDREEFEDAMQKPSRKRGSRDSSNYYRKPASDNAKKKRRARNKAARKSKRRNRK